MIDILSCIFEVWESLYCININKKRDIQRMISNETKKPVIRKKKKQHFVPKFYLKYFADDENKFYRYDFLYNGERKPSRVHYESQCHRKYFYGEDGVLEERLSNKEGQWASACRKAISGESLCEADKTLLKEFVLYQKQRTSDNYNRIREDRESIIREWARMLYAHKGWKYDDEAEMFCKKRASEDSSPAENVLLASKMLDCISDLGLLIVHYSTDNVLLTTDSPVVTLNPFMGVQGFGYGCIGIVFLMPISPSNLLIVYDDCLYKEFKGCTYFEGNNEEEVKRINQYEIIHAERMFFTADKRNFDLLEEEVISYREREKKRRKTQFLGPEGSQRLIMSQTEGIDCYYKLPYILLPREYHRIPYNCREAIPRCYDKGWAEKLSMKYKVLRMAHTLSINKENSKLFPSKTELKMGCRKMEALANIYWKEREHDMQDTI